MAKTILIIGTSTGIGYGTAKAFTAGRLLNWTLPSMLPHAWLDLVLSRMIGLKKPRLSLLPPKL